LVSFKINVHANLFNINFELFRWPGFVVNRFENVSFKWFSLCTSSHLCREPHGTVFDPGFHLTFKFDRKLLLVDLRIWSNY